MDWNDPAGLLHHDQDGYRVLEAITTAGLSAAATHSRPNAFVCVDGKTYWVKGNVRNRLGGVRGRSVTVQGGWEGRLGPPYGSSMTNPPRMALRSRLLPPRLAAAGAPPGHHHGKQFFLEVEPVRVAGLAVRDKFADMFPCAHDCHLPAPMVDATEDAQLG